MGAQETNDDGMEPPRVVSRFFLPPEEFKGCFTTFYRLELNIPPSETLEDYMQPEWAGIRFFTGSAPSARLGNHTMSGARFSASGPTSQAALFTIGRARMWGIGFMPLGWARYFNVEAQALANVAVDGERHPAFSQFADLADILCDADANEKDQYDAIVAKMRALARPNPDEERILRVHRILLDDSLGKVTDFAERAEMNMRSLQRLCHRYFGFSPKLLIRRQRFMRSLTAFMLRGGGKWSSAMDEHYHDQAQFSREFRKFMTMNPREYAELDHPILASFVAARAQAVGSPAQTLDQPGG